MKRPDRLDVRQVYTPKDEEMKRQKIETKKRKKKHRKNIIDTLIALFFTVILFFINPILSIMVFAFVLMPNWVEVEREWARREKEKLNR